MKFCCVDEGYETEYQHDHNKEDISLYQVNERSVRLFSFRSGT